MPYNSIHKYGFLILVAGTMLAGVLVSGGLYPVMAADRVHSDIQIVLQPDDARLGATVTTDLRPDNGGRVEFYLSPRAKDLRVTVDQQPVEFFHRNGRLVVDTRPGDNHESPVSIVMRYNARFSDPIPQMPANTDNPGFGVTASIGSKGTFLLAGSGWYPEPSADSRTYRVRVDAPAGILAVTAGRLMGHTTAHGRTLSDWRVDHPVRGLSISAARYDLQTRQVGQVTAATYFFQDSGHLVKTYLDAVERYLSMYQQLFGNYPFEKFAVVENFFPTGYGFPSYTLLGSRVLRLPFIPYTSLGHEIAHCWWGNGVYVDFGQGNWSEGLTTYVADYLYKEQRSSADALEYRRQWLRNYASLVDSANDFALTQFTSRVDPVSKTIGYDKSAMVFHMVRMQIGDDHFWATLKDVYQRHLFEAITWDDWRRSFESRSGVSLKPFFEQWVNRSGAPLLVFEDLRLVERGGKQVVTGSIVQQPPYFSLAADLLLETQSEKIVHKIEIKGGRTRFRLQVSDQPVRLTFDPDFQLMRRLHPVEIPPTVNSIKGAETVTIVMADGLPGDAQQSAELLARALGLDRVRIVNEKAIDGRDVGQKDLILFGRPQRLELQRVLGRYTDSSIRRTLIVGAVSGQPGDVYFSVLPNADNPARSVALLWPADSTHAATVARKVTHYGKYSYLIFRNGRNIDKGTWPVNRSPLIVNWR